MGDVNGEVLVFLAGFPDDMHTGFKPLFEELQKKYFIISLCLPGLEPDVLTRKRWGYDFPILLDMMHNTIMKLKPRIDQKVNLILHDWGSIVGMLYQNKYPDNVQKLVVMDVGIIYFPELKYLFHMLLYQVTFALCYYLSQMLHINIGNFLYKCFLILLYTFPELSPTPYDKVHRIF